mgnify:CR=1 FL=1
MDKDKQLLEKKWSQKKENWWILVGFIIAVSAISVPFLLIWVFNQNYHLSSFEKLGTVGDFFGGTTVGLLSLASIIFVTAAIIMQKEELNLQRIEVKKTREEYEITNTTMKRQQFDSTFFNMINLHHAITKDIVIEDTNGRAAMKKIIEELKQVYNKDVYNAYIVRLKQEALQGSKDLLDDLVRNEFYYEHYNNFINKNEPVPTFNHFEDDADTTAYDIFHESLKLGTNKEWNSLRVELTKKYEEEVYMTDNSYGEWLKTLSFKESSQSYSTVYTDKFNREFINEPQKELKVEAFEKVYNFYGSQLGHYFRNLYHISKLIHDENFHENEKDNNREKQKYRGILRAQLSSYELLVIFYNLVYSSNGEKFKKIMIDTHFFEDHLSNKDFIWSNDKIELELMDPS